MLFTNKKDAALFTNEFRYCNSKLAEIEIKDASVQEYDMQWITNVPDNSTMNEAIEYARNYWKGLKTKNPIMEVLIYGTIKIESLHSLQCANYHRKYDKSNDNCNYGC